MTTQQQRQRRTEQRLEAGRRAEASQRRARRVPLAAAAIGALIVAGGGAVVLFAFGGDTSTQSTRTAAAGSFGPHSEGLAARRSAAKVTTMNSDAHSHTLLTIRADGRDLPLPAGIGIDPGQDSMQMVSADRLGPYHQRVSLWVDGKPSRAFEALRLRDGQRITIAVGRR